MTGPERRERPLYLAATYPAMLARVPFMVFGMWLLPSAFAFVVAFKQWSYTGGIVVGSIAGALYGACVLITLYDPQFFFVLWKGARFWFSFNSLFRRELRGALRTQP